MLPDNFARENLAPNIRYDLIEHFCQHLEHRLSFGVSVCRVGYLGEDLFELFCQLFELYIIRLNKKELFLAISCVKFCVSSFLYRCFGAKLSVSPCWCQIVQFNVLVPNCSFAFLVANCQATTDMRQPFYRDRLLD